jgi:hypothetical protein
MIGVESEIGSSGLRLWIAAGSAAILVALCAAAFAKLRANALNAATAAGVVALGGLLGAAMVWALLGDPGVQDHGAERRALAMRAQELTARTLAPGSALACLDAVAGETVDAACEKALFASPAAVAAATSYAAARLELLADMVAYAKHGGADIDGALRPLRHALEADSFGFVAHALAVRDGCTSAHCQALDVLHDASRVRTNLSAATFDGYLARYLTAWAQPPDVPAPVADAGAPGQPASQPGVPGQRKLVNIDFPTAASIPAVSIMNPEPGTKVQPTAAANPTAPASTAAAAAPAKRSRKAVANPAASVAAAPSAPPETVSPDGRADPVWAPVPPAPPAQAAAANAPPAAAAPGWVGPVQLTPQAQ